MTADKYQVKPKYHIYEILDPNMNREEVFQKVELLKNHPRLLFYFLALPLHEESAYYLNFYKTLWHMIYFSDSDEKN